MFKSALPRATPRTLLRTVGPQCTYAPSRFYLLDRSRRGYATEAGILVRSPQSPAGFANKSVEEKDLVIIGGGVAGYVAAIKAGQSGLKVFTTSFYHPKRI